MSDISAADAAVAALGQAAASVEVAATATEPMLVFQTSERWVAVPARAVVEVVTRTYVTRIPWASEIIQGVALIRGQPVPVLSLDRLFALESGRPDTLLPRLIVVESGEHRLAMSADHTYGVVDLEPPVRTGDGIATDLTWGDRIVWMLDVAALVALLQGERA